MAEFVKTKTGTNRTRSERAIKDKAFDSIRDLQLLETRSEHFLRVLGSRKVSTNNYLRRFHNFAVDMGWLPWPVLPKRQWPAIRYKDKRAITRDEHETIVRREGNAEMRAFLWCCWHIGGSQSDVAHLKAGDIDWQNQVVSFFRSKTGSAQIIRFGPDIGGNFAGTASNRSIVSTSRRDGRETPGKFISTGLPPDRNQWRVPAQLSLCLGGTSKMRWLS